MCFPTRRPRRRSILSSKTMHCAMHSRRTRWRYAWNFVCILMISWDTPGLEVRIVFRKLNSCRKLLQCFLPTQNGAITKQMSAIRPSAGVKCWQRANPPKCLTNSTKTCALDDVSAIKEAISAGRNPIESTVFDLQAKAGFSTEFCSLLHYWLESDVFWIHLSETMCSFWWELHAELLHKERHFDFCIWCLKLFSIGSSASCVNKTALIVCVVYVWGSTSRLFSILFRRTRCYQSRGTSMLRIFKL